MSFTYIISSLDDLSNPARANNCYVTLGGLPERTRYFRCRVLNFSINTASFPANYMAIGSSHYVQLVSDNFIIGSARSGNKSLQTIATYSVENSIRTGEVFTIANFNGKVINFRILNEFEADVAINQNATNTVWSLALELTPIDDCC